MNMDSIIVFEYQVIDGHTIRTIMDKFRKVYYLYEKSVIWNINPFIPRHCHFLPFAVICSLFHNVCDRQIQYYYVHGEKYQQITVLINKTFRYRVFLIQNTDHNMALQEI